MSDWNLFLRRPGLGIFGEFGVSLRSLARGGRKQTVYRQESSRRIYLTAADVTEVQKNMPLSKFASPYDSFGSTWKSTRCMLYTICSPRKLKCTRYNFAKTRRPRRARYHLISADWLVHSFRTMRRVGAEKKHAHAYGAPDELCAVMHTVMHCDFLPFPPRRVTSDQQRIRAAPPVSGSFLPNRVPPDRPRWQHCSFAPWQRRHRQLYKQSHPTAHFHHYLKYDRIRRQQGNRRHQTSPPVLPPGESLRSYSCRLRPATWKVTSPTKPEVHDVLYCRRKRMDATGDMLCRVHGNRT